MGASVVLGLLKAIRLWGVASYVHESYRAALAGMLLAVLVV